MGNTNHVVYSLRNEYSEIPADAFASGLVAPCLRLYMSKADPLPPGSRRTRVRQVVPGLPHWVSHYTTRDGGAANREFFSSFSAPGSRRKWIYHVKQRPLRAAATTQSYYYYYRYIRARVYTLPCNIGPRGMGGGVRGKSEKTKEERKKLKKEEKHSGTAGRGRCRAILILVPQPPRH